MKRKVFFLPLFVSLFSITGCMVDYGVDFIYVVKNQLDQSIIVHIDTYQGSQDITIGVSATKEIFRDSDLCGKHYIPRKGAIPFDLIYIYHDQNIKIDKDFMDGDYWDYTGIEYEGKYVLTIDASLLK